MDKIVRIGKPDGPLINVKDYTGILTDKNKLKHYQYKDDPIAFVCSGQTTTIDEYSRCAKTIIHLHTSFVSRDVTPEELERDWTEVENPYSL